MPRCRDRRIHNFTQFGKNRSAQYFHFRSFIAEGFHRIDSEGSAGWEVSGEDGDGEQDDHGGQQADGVGALETEEHVGNEAVTGEGCRDADGYADSDKKQNLAHDEPAYVGAGCAKCWWVPCMLFIGCCV